MGVRIEAGATGEDVSARLEPMMDTKHDDAVPVYYRHVPMQPRELDDLYQILLQQGGEGVFAQLRELYLRTFPGPRGGA